MNQMEGSIEPIAKVASTAVVVSVGELPSMTGKTYVLGGMEWRQERPFRDGDVAVVVQSSLPVGTGVDARLELWSDESWRVRLRVFNALGRTLPGARHAVTVEVYAEVQHEAPSEERGLSGEEMAAYRHMQCDVARATETLLGENWTLCPVCRIRVTASAWAEHMRGHAEKDVG